MRVCYIKVNDFMKYEDQGYETKGIFPLSQIILWSTLQGTCQVSWVSAIEMLSHIINGSIKTEKFEYREREKVVYQRGPFAWYNEEDLCDRVKMVWLKPL